MNSTIKRKKCKCGCHRWPTLGYKGFSIVCASQEIKDAVGSKKKVQQRNKNARNRASLLLKKDNPQIQDDRLNKEAWFRTIRDKLTGVCQCGCGQPSQKKDEMYFRHSCCHLFPKRMFPSVQYHDWNFVERAFFGGCHSVFDDTSMDRWVNMADWEDIKAKFMLLAPLLSKEEQATKFYSQFEKLVLNN